jgi:hypothetical protein
MGQWQAVARATLLVATVAVPAGVAVLIAGGSAGGAVLMGTVLTLAGAMASGVPAARRAVVAMTFGAGLGAMSTGSWAWVLVVTVMAVIAGLEADRQAMPAFTLAAIMAVMAPAATTVLEVGIFALGAWLGALYGLAIARRLDPTPSIPDTVMGPAMAATVLGLGVASTAAIAVVMQEPRATWIPLTVLVVVGTAPRGYAGRTRDRVTGTVAGVAIALVLVALHPPSWLVTMLGLAAVIGSLAAAAGPYWLQVTWITLAVVLTAGPVDRVVDTATSRLGFTAAAGAVLAMGLVVARRLLPRLPDPSTTDAASP